MSDLHKLGMPPYFALDTVVAKAFDIAQDRQNGPKVAGPEYFNR